MEEGLNASPGFASDVPVRSDTPSLRRTFHEGRLSAYELADTTGSLGSGVTVQPSPLAGGSTSDSRPSMVAGLLCATDRTLGSVAWPTLIGHERPSAHRRACVYSAIRLSHQAKNAHRAVASILVGGSGPRK